MAVKKRRVANIEGSRGQNAEVLSEGQCLLMLWREDQKVWTCPEDGNYTGERMLRMELTGTRPALKCKVQGEMEEHSSPFLSLDGSARLTQGNE